MNRKMQAMLVMPLVVIPFCAVVFYAAGGGRGKEDDKPKPAGLNTTLPSASVDRNAATDKLSLYQKAQHDSVEQQRQLSRERFSIFGRSNADFSDGAVASPFAEDSDQFPPHAESSERTARRVSDKIKILQDILSREQAYQAENAGAATNSSAASPLATPQQLLELERTMSTLQQSSPEDPELQRMEAMLEKIIDIQHPELVRQRTKQGTGSAKRLLVTTRPLADSPSSSDTSAQFPPDSAVVKAAPAAAFFSLNAPPADTSSINTISAVVHQTTTLVNGGNLKLRLTQDVYIGSVRIPAGTFVTGVCQLSGERLEITVSAIQYRSTIYPVALTAYSLDGIPGIVMKGSITRDAAKQGTDQAIQSIGMASLDPSVAAQAASAGIDAAKRLLSRKVRLVSVTAREDHPLLLKPASNDKSIIN